MKSLRVIRAKPNPAGKDRSRYSIPPAQLAAEWVDFQNNGTEGFPLTGVSLEHMAYQPGCRDGTWQTVMTFQGELAVGKIIRVHSGNGPFTVMHVEDAFGADYHLFTGGNYVWNNDCGDRAGLWNGTTWIDLASYDPYPPEGVILHRVGDKLVPQGLGIYKF